MNTLELAKEYGRSFCQEIEPEIARVEYVGAIRRKIQQPEVITMLIIPKRSVNHLGYAVIKAASAKPYKLGAKVMSFSYIHYKINIFTATSETWEILKFIRTGPQSFSKKACQKAKELGMILHIDGSCLEIPDPKTKIMKKIYPNSEEDIFRYLGWQYITPEQRI